MRAASEGGSVMAPAREGGVMVAAVFAEVSEASPRAASLGAVTFALSPPQPTEAQPSEAASIATAKIRCMGVPPDADHNHDRSPGRMAIKAQPIRKSE